MNKFEQPVHKNKKTDFHQPSIEQVIEHFQIKGCYDQKQPLLFMAHYESNGWYVGKTKMRSFRAAIAGWILRMDQFKANTPTAIKPVDTSEKSDLVKLQEQRQIQLAYKNQRND